MSIFVLESSQNWTVLGVIPLHFKVFSEDQGAKWGIYIFLGVAKISNIFQSMSEIPDFFFFFGKQ